MVGWNAFRLARGLRNIAAERRHPYACNDDVAARRYAPRAATRSLSPAVRYSSNGAASHS